MSLKQMETLLFGDGNGNVGLIRRVDRLERGYANQTYCIKSLWVALLSILTALAISWIQFHR